MTLAISLVNPMPVLTDGRGPVITSKFFAENPERSTHKGVDMLYPHKDEPIGLPWTNHNQKFSVRDGIPALAAAAGTVVDAGIIGTGGRVRIDHGNGINTAYMHLRNLKVKPGQKVRAGQAIGTVSYDPKNGLALNHLHFEMTHNGMHLNPRPFIEAAMPSGFPGSYLWLIGGLVAVIAGVYASKYIR